MDTSFTSLVEPVLPGVKVKERTAVQLRRLPKAIIEELTLTTLEEGLSHRAAGTEWRLVVNLRLEHSG